MRLSTAYSSGIEESDRNSAMLQDIYNNIIKFDESRGSTHFQANVNNVFANGYGCPNIASWLWYKIYKQLPTNKVNKLIITAANIDGTSLRASHGVESIGYSFNANYSSALTPTGYRIIKLNIYRVSRGINNTFEVLDSLEEQLHRLKDLELPFLQSTHHKLRLYRDNAGAITMVTNQFDANTTFWKMLGMLPFFYPEIKEHCTNDQDLLTMFKAFYECDGDQLIPLLTKEFTEIEKIKELKNITKFEQMLKTLGNRQITTLRSEIDNLQRTINNDYQHIQINETAMNDKKRMLTGLEIIGTNVDTAALDFLKNSKAISISTFSDITVTFKVVTPIANYMKQDMESYYKSNNENYVTETDWIASLLKETLIEEKYQFVFTTFVRLPIAGGSWQVSQDNSYYTGNPHLTRYDCFTPARNMMNKFINEGRVLDLLNQLVATCASLNVVDGTVMRALIEELKNGYTYDHNIIQNIETGELITPKQYYESYNSIKPTDEIIMS